MAENTIPVRLQLSRKKGFNLQAHSRAVNGLPAVNCARPSRWGNPFIIGDGTSTFHCDSTAECVEAYRYILTCGVPIFLAKDLPELRGKNLACWCAVDAPHCHADVLLELANEGADHG